MKKWRFGRNLVTLEIGRGEEGPYWDIGLGRYGYGEMTQIFRYEGTDWKEGRKVLSRQSEYWKERVNG